MGKRKRLVAAGGDTLDVYRGKRDAARTPEPMLEAAGRRPVDAGSHPIFVVQEHHARALHWDFRLQRDGVLVSWALPKGVPVDPGQDHLAAKTEDHPLAYAEFTGQIPAGEYGGGTVPLFDHGTYETVKWTDREVKVVLSGQRLAGGYALFQTQDGRWMIHRERQALPVGVAPMLAGGDGGLPPDDGRWGYEMKWDGMRTLAYHDAAGLRLRSRTDRDVTGAFPELGSLAAALGKTRVLLDGEIVVFDGAGRPSFGALQQRMNITSPARAAQLAAQVPVTYLVFDVLHLAGRSLLDMPYQQRRALLEGLGVAGVHWATPPVFLDAPGADVAAASVGQHLEGVVAKRLDSAYEPGRRSPHWRKIKNVHRQEVVVGGFSPGEGGRAGRIGSLLIGVYDGAGLVYAGRVGTGFSQQALALLGARLAPLRRASSPFAAVPRAQAAGAIWVEPQLVIEVAFAEWTGQNHLRHPSYQGLRTDKDPSEVVREP